MTHRTQGERIAALEVEVAYLRAEIAEMKTETVGVNRKLDDLLALRDKGFGAFWLASALFGGGIFGVFATLSSWWRG